MSQRTTQSNHRRNSRKRKQRARTRLFLGLCIGCLALVIFTLLLLPAAFRAGEDKPAETSAALGVKAITVTGNTRYDNEAIIGVSGISVGQSVFSVSKGKAASNIKKEFFYAEQVKIKIGINRHVEIRITEAKELGAVYAAGQWIVVSGQGRGLQAMPMTGERPLRRVYLKGATVVSTTLGEQVVEDRSLAIINELTQAMEKHRLEGVGVIDIEDRNDIRLSWKNQIEIRMGNDSNLTYEVAVAVSALPKILQKHGETASGVLNLSLYSDPSVESPSVIFTPSALLDTPAAEGGTETSGTGTETGGSTAATSGGTVTATTRTSAA